MNYDLVIRNAQVALWDEQARKHTFSALDVAIHQGKIAAIGNIAVDSGAANLDAKGLTLIPGAIDTQVHFREPGFPEKEDLASGTLSAIFGGVTSLFEMPNTKPPTLTAIEITDKLNRAKGRAWCNYAFYVGTSPLNLEKLADLEKMPGTCGVKMFLGSSTGNLVIGGYENAKKALSKISRRAAIHSEDEDILTARKSLLEENKGNVAFHAEWRSVESAITSTKKICTIAQETNKKIHVLHVTSAEEMEYLASLKDLTVQNEKLISVEVTPQHLTLSAPECYERLGTLAQMNPPIRDSRHLEALWSALNAHVVDVIGSDHAPHTRAEKAKTYPDSPSGMTGVQTLLPVMLNHVHNGRLSLDRLLQMVCVRPCELFHIEKKGRIAIGYDADFALLDLQSEKTIENKWIQSKCGWTPFDGMKVHGWVVATVIAGRIVYRDGEAIGSPAGKPLEFSGI